MDSGSDRKGCRGFGVEGLGLGLGLRIQSLGSRVCDLLFRGRQVSEQNPRL